MKTVTRYSTSIKASPMRYRLRTLLILMSIAAVVCLALRAPSVWWSGGIVGVFLATWVTSVLIAIYRSGQIRAMAIGFCIFSSGFVAIQGALWTRSSNSLSLPTRELIRWSFDKLHRRETAAGVANDPFGPAAVAADDPFAPDSLLDRFNAYETICIASLAFVAGVIGAGVAQGLERTRRSPGVP